MLQGSLASGATITKDPADTGTAAFTPIITAGVITGVTVTNTVSSLADGTYPLTITDVPGGGIGATGTYTVATLVVTAAAITLGGVIGPVDPSIFFTTFQQSVNGVIMRDIDPDDMLSIAFAQSQITRYVPRAGELPFYFTEPWRNVNRFNDTTSWDLIGQSTWQIKGGITRNITSPGVSGWYEFDFLRNQRSRPRAPAAQLTSTETRLPRVRITWHPSAGRCASTPTRSPSYRACITSIGCPLMSRLTGFGWWKRARARSSNSKSTRTETRSLKSPTNRVSKSTARTGSRSGRARSCKPRSAPWSTAPTTLAGGIAEIRQPTTPHLSSTPISAFQGVANQQIIQHPHVFDHADKHQGGHRIPPRSVQVIPRPTAQANRRPANKHRGPPSITWTISATSEVHSGGTSGTGSIRRILATSRAREARGAQVFSLKSATALAAC